MFKLGKALILNNEDFSKFFEELGGPSIFLSLVTELPNPTSKFINEFSSIVFDLIIRKQNSKRIIESIIAK